MQLERTVIVEIEGHRCAFQLPGDWRNWGMYALAQVFFIPALLAIHQQIDDPWAADKVAEDIKRASNLARHLSEDPHVKRTECSICSEHKSYAEARRNEWSIPQ